MEARNEHGRPDSTASTEGGSLTPPTPEQFTEHLEVHYPNPPSAWMRFTPVAVLLAAVLVSVLLGGPIAWLLPWAVLIGLVGWLTVRVRRERRLQKKVLRLQEQTMLRQYRDVLRDGWLLLAQLTARPLLYARTVAMLAQCLDEVYAHESAIVGYDHLIEHLPPEHPGALHLRAQRAMAALAADRLVEADEDLRVLRQRLPDEAPAPLRALRTLAILTQQCKTHHYEDAVAESETLVDELRPLGVDASYGYALMALSEYECARHEDRPDAPGDAQPWRTWWERATLLLPVEALVGRFAELDVMARST